MISLISICLYFRKKSVYFRDISACAIPSYLDVDSNTLYKIANILDSPLNVPEKILINILKSKYKLNVLKSLSADEELPKIKKCKTNKWKQNVNYIYIYIFQMICATY